MNRKKKLLVVDLDETIWASVNVPGVYGSAWGVILRPGLEEFLTRVTALYQVAIWTAATPDWAQEGLESVREQTGHDLLRDAAFIWTRERCATRYDPETQQRQRSKPLQKVWRDRRWSRAHTLAIDDLPSNFASAYGNYVRVTEFGGDMNDTELPALATYLERLHQEPDFRKIEKRGWRQQAGVTGAP